MSQTPPWQPAAPDPSSGPPPAGDWGSPGGPAAQAQADARHTPVPPVPQMAPAPPPRPLGQSPYGARPPEPQPAGQGSYGQFTFPVIDGQRLEPLAVASVATAVLGPVGILLGVLALRRIRVTKRRSTPLAWTGIALASLVTVGWVLLAVTLALNGTIERALERPQEGDVAAARTIASANLATGNCVEFLPPAEQVGEVRVVPCARPHIAQVLDVHVLDGDHPGLDALAERARELCASDLESLGETGLSLAPWYLAPSEQGWAQGNTGVVCLARGAAGPFDVDLVNG